MKKGKTGRRLLIALAMLVLLAVTVSAAMLHNDYNGDGQVGSQDAVYLFKHLTDPKTYPISQSGDVDGDGQKDQADALYLLRHSLNPEKYPLEERHTEEIIPGKAATCTETGLTEGLRCSVCETVLKEQEVIPALGHQPDESNWKTNASRHWRSCRRSACAEELSAGEHVYTDWLLVEAGGCSLQDYHVRACRTCGHCETDLPDNVLHAHVWTMESKAATCTEGGYEAYVHCVNCDKVAYRENLPALGHDFKNAPYTSTEYNHKQTCQRENCTVELTGSHSWGDWIMDAPETCTADGSKHRICYECKYRGEETVPAGHILTQVDAKAPTCTEVGHNAYEYCTRCSHSTYQEKAALGHMVNTKLYDKDSSHHWHYCSRGNCSYTEGKAVHSFGGWTVRRGATCTEAGVEYRSCVCGYEETRLLPAPGHQMSETYEKNEDGHWLICLRAYCGYKTEVQDHEYGAWTEIKPAKCEETGKKERSCTVCGYAQQEVIPELGHDYAGAQWSSDEETHWKNCLRSGCTSGISQGKHSWSVWITDIPAQCEAAGSKHRTCEICERRVEEMIPALGHSYFGEWQYDDQNHWKECIHDGCTQKDSLDSHSFGGWTVRQEPTCTAQGEEYRRCICGYEETRPMAIVDHLLSDTYEKNSGGHWQKCTRSGCEYKTETEEHTYSDWTVTVPAECEKNGYQEHACAVCGYVESETIPALRHMTGDWIPGENQHYMHCDRCGLNHNYQNHDWQITEHAATCETGAYKLSECHVCGFSKEETTGKPLGHNWETDYNETYHWEVCRRSGCGLQTVAEPHTMDQWETVTAADCEEKGEEERKCTGCKYTETREIGPNGHSWSVKLTVAPGCVTEGYTLYECGGCGKTESRDVKEPLGHTDGQNNTNWHKDDGDSHWLICIRCGQNYEKADHSWSDWQTLTPAACETEGRQRRSCSVCGRQEEEAIPATGHNHSGSWVQGSSTHYKLCANDGCREILDEKAHSKGSIQRNDAFHFYTCTVCGKTPLEQEVHTYGDWQTVTAATCTEKGLQKHYCTACSWEDILTNTLDKLPHDLYITVDTRQIQQTGETVYAHTVVEKCRYECDYYAVIGETAVHVHNEVDTVITPATCTEPGSVVVKCKVPGCGDVFLTEELPPLGHNFVESTCTHCGLMISQGLEFTLSDDGTYYIVSGIGTCTDTEIVIPSTHEGKPVKEIGKRAFEGGWYLTKITILDGITKIGESAFVNCTGLTEVTIPASISSIDIYAFYLCSSLKKVCISDIAAWCRIEYHSSFSNPLSYARNLYLNGSIIKNLIIPNNVTQILNYAFDGCSCVETIYIPDSVKSIGTNAFTHCNSLVSIYVDEGNQVFHSDGNCLIKTDKKSLIIGCATSTIPSDGSVTSIALSAFYGCNSLKQITIPDSIIKFDTHAFAKCSALETIYYVGTIGQWNKISKGYEWDFNCTYELICLGDPKPSQGLEFTLSDDGTYYIVSGIGTCTDTELLIPDTYEGLPVKSVGENAFARNTKITGVTLPEGITSIGNSAFLSTNLTEIVFPDSVTHIGEEAFAFCNELTEVTIGDNVIELGDFAFYCSQKLTNVYVGKNVAAIGLRAFELCITLKGIWVDAENEHFCSDQYGVLFTKDMTLLMQAPFLISGNYQIPDGVVTIGTYAFHNCSYLTGVTFPDSVTTLEESSFLYCSKLASLTLGKNITTIGDNAFKDCSALTEVTFPSTLTSIGAQAFMYCNKITTMYFEGTTAQWKKIQKGKNWDSYYTYELICLGDPSQGLAFTLSTDGTYYIVSGIGTCTDTELVIPETHLDKPVKEIGSTAFNRNKSITKVVLPDSITLIATNAFNGCTSLKELTLGEGVKTVRNYAFSGCTGLEKIYFNAIAMDDLAVNNYAFYDEYFGSGKIHVYIGPKVTGIPAYLFNPYNNRCPKILDVSFAPNSVCTSIGKSAFAYNSYLESITIPDSVKEIGEYAFDSCKSLNNLTFGANVTKIGQYAFRFCRSLSEVTIPKGITTLETGTFFTCTGLKTVNFIKGGLTTNIGDSVFYGCTALESFQIPDCITAIGSTAFKGCSGLKNVTIGNGVISIGSNAFESCIELQILTIGKSVTAVGKAAFNKCTGLVEINFNAANMTDLYSQNYVFSQAGQSAGGITVNIGTDVTKIPAYIFCPYDGANLPKIKEIIFPENSVCSSIGAYVLWRNTYLQSITVSQSVETIGYRTFYSCSNLKTIYYLGSRAQWDQIDKKSEWDTYCTYELICLGDANGSEGLEYMLSDDGTYYILTGMGTCQDTHVVIPAIYEKLPVKVIGGSAFSWNESIVEVEIPESVVTIESGAFYNCTNLYELTIPDSVQTLGQMVCDGCTRLSKVTIGRKVDRIAEQAFYRCTSLQSIQIPNSVKSIDRNAFAGCSGLKTVSVGTGVESVGEYAFEGCTAITAVYITNIGAWSAINFHWDYGNPLSFGGYLYLNNAVASTITITGIDKIGENAFIGCKSLAKVIIGNDVTSIGFAAFYDCSNLQVVTIGNGVQTIGMDAFAECTGLKTVNVGSGVKEIGHNAFYGCAKLVNITFPDGLRIIGDGAFDGAPNIQPIVLPKSIESIGGWAFADPDPEELATVYYNGTASEWAKVTLDPSAFFYVKYYSETKPSSNTGNYWHYVNGVPTVWT